MPIATWEAHHFNTTPNMPAPSGYTTKIFGDTFPGTTLDAGKWNTYLGAEGSRWDNAGLLPSPYSGPNMPGNGFHLELYHPSQVTVNNGLTLTAQTYAGTYNPPYSWIGGCVITGPSLFSLPTTSAWYVQVNAKMPDVIKGMWPAIWFLRGPSGTPDYEIDLHEGGWLGTNLNQLMHTDWGGDNSVPGFSDIVYDSGINLSAGYHVYGMEFIAGTSVKYYIDGTVFFTYSQTSHIIAVPYQIMLQLQVAAPAASGWRTTADGTTPTSSMLVAEVQAWTP